MESRTPPHASRAHPLKLYHISNILYTSNIWQMRWLDCWTLLNIV